MESLSDKSISREERDKRINLNKIGLTEKEFGEEVLNVANDRFWCKYFGINYVSPDFGLIRERLYNQFLELRNIA